MANNKNTELDEGFEEVTSVSLDAGFEEVSIEPLKKKDTPQPLNNGSAKSNVSQSNSNSQSSTSNSNSVSPLINNGVVPDFRNQEIKGVTNTPKSNAFKKDEVFNPLTNSFISQDERKENIKQAKENPRQDKKTEQNSNPYAVDVTDKSKDNTKTQTDKNAQIQNDVDTGKLEENDITSYKGASNLYNKKAKEITGKDGAQALVDYGKVIGVDDDLFTRLDDGDKGIYQNQEQLKNLYEQRDILSNSDEQTQKSHLAEVNKAISEIEKTNAQSYLKRNSEIDSQILGLQKQLNNGTKVITVSTGSGTNVGQDGLEYGATKQEVVNLSDDEKSTIKSQIQSLQKRKEAFLKDASNPQEVYQDLLPKVKMYEDKNIIPKDASVIDKLKIYYGIKLTQLNELKKKEESDGNSFLFQANPILKAAGIDTRRIGKELIKSISQRIPGIDDRNIKAINDIELELDSIAPIIAINAYPNAKRNGVVKTFVNKVTDDLSQTTGFSQTSQQKASSIGNAMQGAGVELSDDRKQLLETQMQNKDIGQREEKNATSLGSTTAFMVDFGGTSVLAGGILNGVSKGLKLAKLALSPKAVALLGMAETAINETRIGRLAVNVVDDGLKYEITGDINKVLKENSNFSQGASGAIGSKLGEKTIEKLASILGKKAGGFLTLVFDTLGRTGVELFEETAQNTDQLMTEITGKNNFISGAIDLFKDSEKGKAFTDGLKQQYGNIDDDVDFVLQIAAMSTAFNIGKFGKYFKDLALKKRNELSPTDREKYDVIVHGMQDEVKDVEDKAVDEVAKLDGKKKEEVVAIINNKIGEAETQNTYSTPEEKAISLLPKPQIKKLGLLDKGLDKVFGRFEKKGESLSEMTESINNTEQVKYDNRVEFIKNNKEFAEIYSEASSTQREHLLNALEYYVKSKDKYNPNHIHTYDYVRGNGDVSFTSKGFSSRIEDFENVPRNEDENIDWDNVKYSIISPNGKAIEKGISHDEIKDKLYKANQEYTIPEKTIGEAETQNASTVTQVKTDIANKISKGEKLTNEEQDYYDAAKEDIDKLVAGSVTKVTENATVSKAVIEIGGKMYEGNNHAEAILKAKADGQDVSQVDRQAQGKFKLSDGTIIDRAESKSRFGQDRSELMIPQDENAKEANKEYAKITRKPLSKIAEKIKLDENQVTPIKPINTGQEQNNIGGVQQTPENNQGVQQGDGQNVSNENEVAKVEEEQEVGSGGVGGDGKKITITGYRNKGSKDVGENGTFYTQSEQDRPTNKKEISFDNALVLTDEQVEQFEGLPNEYLAYEWFPDVDFTKEAKRQGISESGHLMDKMVTEEAIKRGYDGIVYGTNEIVDLRTHPKAVEQSLKETTKAETPKIEEGSGGVELIDTENYTEEDKNKRDNSINENGYHYVNIYEGQFVPLNIGLSGYGDISATANGKMEYYNSTSKEMDIAINVGDKVSFSAFVRDGINSVGKYKVRNETTGKEYPLQWFTKSNDPRIALKEVQDKLGISKEKTQDQSLKETTKAEPQEVLSAKNEEITPKSSIEVDRNVDRNEILAEIKSKNLTHVKGKNMGENQALGTYISTEKGNRYETPTQKAEKVEVDIENPYVVDNGDFGLVDKRQEVLNNNRDKFTAEDSNDYQELPKGKLTVDDLNDAGIKKLAELTTNELKVQGYDAIYFKESDTQEGELVVFDKEKVKFEENIINLVEDKAENELANNKLTKQDNIEQEPSIKDIEGKAESNNEVELNEVVKKSDELINNALDVVNVPISEIKTNENEYQGRKNKFSERSANKVHKQFDKNKFNPIILYKHPDGNTYVLSGHSRLEGMKRRGEKNIPASYFEGTAQEAQTFAKNSNKLGALQTDLENANYYHEEIKKGRSYNSILEEAKENEQDGSAKKIVSLAHLNPNGKAMNALEKTENSESDGGRNLTNIGIKIGHIRALNEHITDAHENELFEYMMQDKDNIPTDKELADQNNPINRSINSVRFDNKQPLNLDKFQNKSDSRIQWEAEKKELEQQVANIRKDVNASKKTGWTGLKEKAIASIAKDKTKESIDKAEKDFNNNVNGIKDNYQKLLEKKRDELNAVSNKLAKHLLSEKNLIEGEKNQQSLFQSTDKNFTPISKSKFNELLDKLKKAFPNVKVELFGKNDFENAKKELEANGIKIQDIQTKDGTIYGFKTPDGKVFLNSDNLNANTPIHEYGHIWQSVFPQGFARGIELLKLSPQGQKLIAEIQKNPAYKGKSLAEIHAEALVTAIGNKGEQTFKGNPSALKRFQEWLTDFFKTIGDKLGIKDLSADDKLDMFTKKVVGELLGGKVLDNKVGTEKATTKTISFQGKDIKVKEINGGAEVINGFYSPLEKIINESKQDKMPVKQWLEKFVRGEEAKFTGLIDWLNSQDGSVSKADIQQFLKDNRIQVVEVVKTEDGTGTNESVMNDTKFSQYQLEGEKSNYKEVLVTMPKKSNEVQLAELDAFKKELSQKYGEGFKGSQLTDSEIDKLQDFKLNAKEEADKFKSNHWSEPNILVHLRMNTRVDAEGKKVLFLEELQSDWGQIGKKEGFGFNEKNDYNKLASELQGEYEVDAQDIFSDVINVKQGTPIQKLNAMDRLTKYFGKERALKIVENQGQSKIPPAPFVTDTNAWTKLALKVAIKEAVKQGAEKIGCTTGEQQNERYDLSKQVQSISYEKKSKEFSSKAQEKGQDLYSLYIETKEIGYEQFDDLTISEVEGYVGKDIANKIQNNEGNKENLDTSKGNKKVNKLTGIDLKVGGKGMKGFYGSPTENSLGIVGNVAKSLFKQEPKTVSIETAKNNEYTLGEANYVDGIGVYDGKGDMVAEFDTKAEANKFIADKSNQTQHSIDITPEMKEMVQFGQPLFQVKDGLKEFVEDAKKEGYTKQETIDYVKDNNPEINEQDVIDTWDAVNENSNIPPTIDVETETISSDGKSVDKTLLKKRIYDNVNQTEKERQEIEQKYGLKRDKIPHEEAKRIAKNIVDIYGLDNAIKKVRNGDIANGVAAEVYYLKFKDLDKEQKEAKTEEEQIKIIGEKANLASEWSNVTTDKAQFISQLGSIYKEDNGLLFNADIQKEEYKRINNGEISDEVAKKFDELEKELKALNKKIDQLESEQKKIEEKYRESISKVDADAAVAEAYEKGKKDGSIGKEAKKYTKKAKEVADKFRELKKKPFEFDDGNGNKVILTENSLVSLNDIIEAGAKIIEASGKIADGINHVINEVKDTDWYKNMSPNKRSEFENKIEEQFGEKKSEVEKKEKRFRIPSSSVKDIVERRRSENEKTTIDDVVEELKRNFPDKTEREIRDAITDYGVTKESSNEPDDVTVRKIKRMGRYLSALEDIENGIRPERSGLQRDKIDAEERAKLREIREELKKLPLSDADLSQKLKTAQDAIETRLNNEIEDLQREIDTLEKTIRIKKDVATTQRIEELKVIRDAKKEERDNLFQGSRYDDVLQELQDIANRTGQKTITKTETKNGLISDLLQAHIEKGTEMKDVQKQMFDDLQAIFPDITQREVLDAIAKKGVFKADDKEKTDLQKKLSELKKQFNLQTKIEDAQKGIVASTKSKGADSPEVQAFKEELKQAREEAKNKYPNVSANELKKQIERVQKSIDNYKAKEANKDYFIEKKIQAEFHKDKVWREKYRELELLKLERAKVKAQFESEKDKIREKNLTLTEKIGENLGKLKRFDIFLDLFGMGRLALAAVARPITNPLREISKLALSYTVPSVMKKSIGNYRKGPMQSIRYLGKYYASYFAKKTYKDAISEFNKRSNFSLTNEDKKGKDRYTTLIGRILSAPEQAHGFMKAFAKLPQYNSTYEIAMENLSETIDPQTGELYDITDPLVQRIAVKEAYREANADVFMDDSDLAKLNSKLWNGAMESESYIIQLIGIYGKQLEPIIKVPANFYGEVMSQMPFVGFARAIMEINRSGDIKNKNNGGYRGVRNLTPEQAQNVQRKLTSQLVGFMGIAIGMMMYKSFGDDAEDELDAIEKWMHNTSFPIIMMGMELAKHLEDEDKYKIAKIPFDEIIHETKSLPQYRVMRDIAFSSDKTFKKLLAALITPSFLRRWALMQDNEKKRYPKTIQDYIAVNFPQVKIGDKVYVKGRKGVSSIKTK